LFLLLLTALGPLAWRKTSTESLRKNFAIPAVIAVAVGVALVAMGYIKPWVDMSYFYSLMTIMLSVLVAATIGSEFIRADW